MHCHWLGPLELVSEEKRELERELSRRLGSIGGTGSELRGQSLRDAETLGLLFLGPHTSQPTELVFLSNSIQPSRLRLRPCGSGLRAWRARFEPAAAHAAPASGVDRGPATSPRWTG